MTAELSTSDIARLRGCDRKTAWRWLRQLARDYGPTVVARRGNRLFTTAAALERVAPALAAKKSLSRLDTVEERLAAQERITERQAAELIELRRLAEMWSAPGRR